MRASVWSTAAVLERPRSLAAHPEHDGRRGRRSDSDSALSVDKPAKDRRRLDQTALPSKVRILYPPHQGKQPGDLRKQDTG
jgi:hypothetical protein